MKKVSIVMAVLLLCLGVVAQAQPSRYVVTWLGPFSEEANSDARCINENGMVAGGDGMHAYVYTSDQGIHDLGMLNGGPDAYPFGINDAGQVVGVAHTPDGVQRCFLYTPGIGMVDLLGNKGGTYSHARDINNHGQIVGNFTAQNGTGHAFVTTAGGSMTDLGLLGGSLRPVTGISINDAGEVVGEGHGAFVYKNGNVYNLDAMAGGTSSGYILGSGNCINNIEQVVGQCTGPFGSACAYIYTLGTSLVASNIIYPLSGGSSITAYGVNDLSQVVGQSDSSGGISRAFLYENGVVYDLNGLIDALSNNRLLTHALAINNKGQIAGFGDYNGIGRAFLMTPVPEPSGLLFLVGGITTYGVLKRRNRGNGRHKF